MGKVKVEVPFSGSECNGCEWEFDGDDVQGDFCGLFNELKESMKRCERCYKAAEGLNA